MCSVICTLPAATPASVRFLGRRVYLAALVVLVSALAQGLTGARQRQLCQRLGPSRRTLRRFTVAAAGAR